MSCWRSCSEVLSYNVPTFKSQAYRDVCKTWDRDMLHLLNPAREDLDEELEDGSTAREHLLDEDGNLDIALKQDRPMPLLTPLVRVVAREAVILYDATVLHEPIAQCGNDTPLVVHTTALAHPIVAWFTGTFVTPSLQICLGHPR